jgi:hypothetical protein
MRFVNLSATSEKVGKGSKKRVILRKAADGQSATLPVLAFGDADTGFFQSADDVLELTTAGVSRMKWDASGITTIAGNLVVSGTTTTIGSTTLTVDDKNIELGSVATPSDTTADGGGITLKGATDKTFNWINSTDAWTSSEHINLASGKTFQLNGTSITSTAAELNLLSSVSGLVQADLTKLAAITSSATELNYTDGVTSAIQTQMNAKAPIASPTFTGNFTSVGIDDNADATAITIDSSERVGIGNTAPAGQLHVDYGSGGYQVMSYSAGGYSGLNWKEGTTNRAYFDWDDGNNRFTWYAGGGGGSDIEMVLLENGNLGIGTLAPDTLLSVRNNTNAAGFSAIFRGGTNALTTANDWNMIGFGYAGSDSLYVNAGIGNIYTSTNGNNDMIFCVKAGGSVNVTNADEKMRISSSGHITPGGNGTQNLGASGSRWANIYTADLQLSNEGKEAGNEIDGTTGNWTIQEGDENLFVINRKTGKKFKMNLTEV